MGEFSAVIALCLSTVRKLSSLFVSYVFIAIAWGPSFALKAKELVYTNALAAHAFHCYWASVYTCFRDLGRMFSRTPLWPRSSPGF